MRLTDPSTLLLILLVVSAAILLLRTRPRRQLPLEDVESIDYGELGKGPPFSDGRLPANLAEWEVQMHETARQLSAQLDAKLSLLQALIADAERVAARLENALERAHRALPPGSQAEALRSVAEHGRDLSELDAAVIEPELSAPGEEPPAYDRARRHAEVYRLADYGLAASEIARRVGSPVGEVELILSLRQPPLSGRE
jgi:hypothetical protein